MRENGLAKCPLKKTKIYKCSRCSRGHGSSTGQVPKNAPSYISHNATWHHIMFLTLSLLERTHVSFQTPHLCSAGFGIKVCIFFFFPLRQLRRAHLSERKISSRAAKDLQLYFAGWVALPGTWKLILMCKQSSPLLSWPFNIYILMDRTECI